MSARIDLRGRSLEEIEELTRSWRRRRFQESLHELATVECKFTAEQVAKAYQLPKRTIVELCKAGKIRANKPLDNKWRISHAALRAWDAATSTAPNGNGSGS